MGSSERRSAGVPTNVVSIAQDLVTEGFGCGAGILPAAFIIPVAALSQLTELGSRRQIVAS
jgi:hypothetical protein